MNKPEVTDAQIGAFWDREIGPGLVASGVPADALASIRRRYVDDVRVNPAALRQITDELEGR